MTIWTVICRVISGFQTKRTEFGSVNHTWLQTYKTNLETKWENYGIMSLQGLQSLVLCATHFKRCQYRKNITSYRSGLGMLLYLVKYFKTRYRKSCQGIIECTWCTNTRKFQRNTTCYQIRSWYVLSICPRLICFCIFNFYVLFGLVLEGVVESCLLSKDELLTPNIDEVMVVWIFRMRAQNTKIGENWTSTS